MVPVIFNEGLWGVGTTMYSVFYGRMGDAAVAAMGVCTTVNDLVWVAIFADECHGHPRGQGPRRRATANGLICMPNA